MIKLIVSDIDGTLLHGDEKDISPRLFSLIPRLNEKGILFAPASGRQYHSLRILFAPVAEQLCYLCENGAEVYGPCAQEEDARPLSQTVMDRALCDQLIGEILAEPDLEVLISGSNMSYLIPRQQDIVNRMRNFTRNNVTIVPSVQAIPGNIIKLAAYARHGAAPYDSTLGQRWRKYFTVSLAGDLWLDFTLANKGAGVRDLCRQLGISPQEVMAFGDHFNDQSMLDTVGRPVIMDNADEFLRRRYPEHCDRVEDFLEAFLCKA